jgi:hypothetical protein
MSCSRGGGNAVLVFASCSKIGIKQKENISSKFVVSPPSPHMVNERLPEPVEVKGNRRAP